jgi:hypothetical protein
MGRLCIASASRYYGALFSDREDKGFPEHESSRSFNFDQRCRPETLRTAIAMAFF